MTWRYERRGQEWRRTGGKASEFRGRGLASGAWMGGVGREGVAWVNQNPTRWIRNGGCWGGRLKGHGGESESYSVNQKWRVLRGSPQRSWGGEVRGQPGWGWWGQGSTRVNQNHQFPTTYMYADVIGDLKYMFLRQSIWSTNKILKEIAVLE